MKFFTKESLETLRQRIDLIDVVGSHVELKKAGATYKALCPFHDEKTPSFIVRRGDTSYHCFGCGAHGDAIQFLMTYMKMSFSDAVESLSEKFGVHLDYVDGPEDKGPSRAAMKGALDLATDIYHYTLLHTPEGHDALKYLYDRGIDLDFIKQFRIGLAAKKAGAFRKMMHAKKISDEIMIASGLLAEREDGSKREFFTERIMFPVNNAMGNVVGFSARKYHEKTFGGKYINTSETPLFKKSQILFALNYCRRRIAKERKAIIVEGQIDALKLIQQGLNITVAPLGTAFCEGHVKALTDLGVSAVYLATDGDAAGKKAAQKIGDLFQKKGVEVYVVAIPDDADPDTIITTHGIEGFTKLLEKSDDFLTFLVKHMSTMVDMSSPAAKSEAIKDIATVIRGWDDRVMIHESLRKLAFLTRVPEDVVGIEAVAPRRYIKKGDSVRHENVDANKILESDLLRWLVVAGENNEEIVSIVKNNITAEDLHDDICKTIFQHYYDHYDEKGAPDMLSLAIALDNPHHQHFLRELITKKINTEKAQEHVINTIQKILERNWIQQKQNINDAIKNTHSDDDTMSLLKQFNDLQKSPPTVS
ncbi:MAG: DNA primase [Waddliaceae bacterium]|jgi:DNA primase|nr:DNA primase [Waddliaceae bacterium]MBT3578625.1 DNA primase [Waddliaceae bacterium]MBT4445344.1 DNA primase [Waddliaceae bacterium]MBT6928388.1 DNA primase [Waddliaceae bacterium]MBT7265074.1 DNA primase [Waddliaceae bacterium]